MSQNETVPIIIPGEVEYYIANHLACLRFHYHLPDGEVIPQADKLFTGLTPEQARDAIVFLKNYVDKMNATGVSESDKSRH
ncbi:hypothetical protein [Erwinia pyrifoliae]|uniref:hypothetical protein n=1 Tax=Erwinia pyrifoliae TaxID=79967 RepID=UPI00220B5CD2|nr:hypothetical protein [Erwinia pyrifoliae]UWS30650.1 hypothetical protein NYP81_04055 [Erwinia pyrifoliae]